MTRRLLAALALVALAASAGAQTDRYVATAAELSAAIRASQPGDTVTMADGTWTDTAIDFDRDGAPADSIRLRAETPGGVVLTGSSTLSIAGDYLVVDGLRFEGGALPDGTPVVQFRRSSSDLANHSRLTNCVITDYNPANTRTEYKWVSVYGRFNRVDHCYFARKTNEGALLVVWLRDPPNDAPPEHRIDHNHFGFRPEFGDNGAETIRIGTSSRSMQYANVVVERNLFTETNGEIEIISNKSNGNVYRSNTFRRAQGTLTLRHGNDCLVEGNFFLGEEVSGSGGVRIIGEDHRVVNNYFMGLRGTGYRAPLSMVQGVENSPLNRYFQVKRPVVAHNTFVDNDRTLVIGVGSSSDQSLPPQDITVVNNAVQTKLSADIVEVDLEPVGTSDWSGNIFFGRPGDLPEGVTFADPELVEAEDGLFRPSPTSPLLDAAVAAFAPATDMDGQARVTPDVGADEVSADPRTLGPLSPEDVGPSYAVATADEDRPERRASRLAPNVPNPFATTTELAFALGRAGPAVVRLFDISGREVQRVLDGTFPAGMTEFTLDGTALPTGTYLVVLEAEGRADYRLVTLAR
ncbi:chondroitinase-B domain-containing protein [Rubrivirga sp. IMCC45206]|uniref:chondroitinase-B domain-containing protein n=1 Tax=Rubrivirga sp. IMCC45206 TaxID=3391614 RepID=UPI00398FA0AF